MSSIMSNNEVHRLFSLAFGKEWIRAGLLERSDDELKQIDSLAEDNASAAISQIAALGQILGEFDASNEVDVRSIGWAIAHLAEYASVTQFIASAARNTRDPRLREVHAQMVQCIEIE
jgi:hypothetical protein